MALRNICLVLFFLALSISLTTPQYVSPVITSTCGWIPAPPTKVSYGAIVTFYCIYDIEVYYHAQPTLGTLSLVVGSEGETPTVTDFYFKSFATTSGTCTFSNATSNMVHCIKLDQKYDPNTFNVTVQVVDAVRSPAWTWEVVFTDSYDLQASATYDIDIDQPNLIADFSPNTPVSFSIGQIVPFSINLTNTGGSFSSPLVCTIIIPAGIVPAGTLPSGCTLVSETEAKCQSSANTPFGAGDSLFYAVNLTSTTAQSDLVINASCADVKGLFGPYVPNVPSLSPSNSKAVASSPSASPVAGTSPSSSPVSGTTTGVSGDGDGTSTTGGDGSTTTGGGDGGTGSGAKLMSWVSMLI